MLGKIQRTLFGFIALLMVMFITVVVIVRVVGSIVASEPERVSAWVESAFDVGLDYQHVQVQSHLDALHFDVQKLSFSSNTVDFSAESLQFDVSVFESILKGRFFGHEFRANKVRFSTLASDEQASSLPLSNLALPWAVVRLNQLEGDIHRDDGLWQLAVDDLITSTHKPFAGNAQVRLSHNHVPLMERFNFSFAQELNSPDQFRFWAALTGVELSDSMSSYWVVHGLTDIEQGLASGVLFSTLTGQKSVSLKSDWYWNSDEAVATNFLVDQETIDGKLAVQWPMWVDEKRVSAQIEQVDMAQLQPWLFLGAEYPLELSGQISNMSLVWDTQKKEWTDSVLQLKDVSVVLPEEKGAFVKHLDLDLRAQASVWTGKVSQSESAAQVFIPTVFSSPLVIENLDMPLVLDTNELSVQISRANFENPHWHLTSDAKVSYLPEESDVKLDVNLYIGDVTTEVAQVLLPDRVLSPMAVKWIREHIREGMVKNAQVRLKGTGSSLARLKHPQHDSYFSAEIIEAEIFDLPNQWPDIAIRSGQVEVVNGQTFMTVSEGKTGDVLLKQVAGTIYQGKKHTRLALKGQARSEQTALIQWLKETPLNERLNLQKNQVNLDGVVSGDIELDLALIEGDEPSTVVTDLLLENANFNLNELAFQNVSGHLHVTESGLGAQRLTLLFENQPFDVSIETLSDNQKRVQIHAEGLLRGEDWHSSFMGVSPIKVDVSVPWSEGALKIQASSHLESTSVDLPFLKKPINELLPVSVEALRDSGHWIVNSEIGASSRVDLRQQGGQWDVDLDMPTVKGVITYSDQWVSADFERLYVFSSEVPSNCSHSNWVGLGQQWRVNIKDLKRNQRSMGRLEFGLLGTESGYEIEKLRLSNHSALIDLQGRWDGQDQRVVLLGEVSADSLKDMLGWVGIENTSVTASQVHGYVNLNGAGGLECLSLQTVNGDGEWVLKDGTIESAEPGLGRLIGLLNFESIKRRLLFDLSDVMGKGLGYDKIWAKVSLSEGLLSVEQLKVDAPSTKVKMWGQVDLIQSLYNLNAQVSPNLRNAAVTVGALTGGPAGAVVGWLGERVMSLTGLSKAVEYDYTITGPFDSPKVESVEK